MLGTTNGDVLGGFGTSSSYKKGGPFDAPLSRCGTTKWANDAPCEPLI